MKYTDKTMELASLIFGTGKVRELFNTSFPFAKDEATFRGMVLAEGCFILENQLTEAIEKKKSTKNAFSDKIKKIESDYERRIPKAYIDLTITSRGKKVVVNECDYIKALEEAIEKLKKEIAEKEGMLKNVISLKNQLPAVENDNVPARVTSRVILRLKDSLKLEDVPAFDETVKACKTWHLHNANHAGRYNTQDAEYKVMKKALEGFMSTFEITEDENYKKVFINLNQKELVELACNVFCGKNIRNVKDKTGKYEFLLTAEGRVKYEVELLNMLVLKWNGGRLA